MRLSTTLDIVKARYNDLLIRFCDELKKSSSKSNHLSEDQFKFRFDWGESFDIEDVDFSDPKEPNISLDDLVEDRLKRSWASLRLSAGRFCRYYSIDIPQEIVDFITKLESDEIERIKEYNSLTEEERGAIIQDELKQLIGTPGFAVFKIYRKPQSK